MYLLTDVTREHYWLGKKGFLPITEAVDYPGAIPCFFTAEAAVARVRALRRRDCRLRVVCDPTTPICILHNGDDGLHPCRGGATFSYDGRNLVTTEVPIPNKPRVRPAAHRARGKKG